MSLRHFEYSTRLRSEFLRINAKIDGFPLKVERTKGWTTLVEWQDDSPDFSLIKFLVAVETAFEEAEEHGYESDWPTMHVGSQEFREIRSAQYERPLLPDDFIKILGVKPDSLTHVGIASDLAHFSFERGSHTMGVAFEEEPHQLRSAFRFMAETIPVTPALSPEEARSFVSEMPKFGTE